MRWHLRLSEFHDELLYCLKLVYEIPNTYSKLFYASEIKDGEPNTNKSYVFECSSATPKQRLNEKGVHNTPFPTNPFETIHVLTQHYTANYTMPDNQLHNGYGAIDQKVESHKHPTFNNATGPLSTLESLK